MFGYQSTTQGAHRGAAAPGRQSALAEFGPRGGGFDPTVYGRHPHQGTQATPGTQGTNPQGHTAIGGGAGAAEAKAPRKSAPRPIRAATLRQLLGAAEATVGGALGGGVVLDGHELGLVAVVGRVLATGTAAEAHNNGGGGGAALWATITDGTGTITCRQWEAPTPDDDLIEVGGYVCASGQLRPAGSGGGWGIVGRVAAEADCNVLTYHMLDAVNTTLRLTRGDPAKLPAARLPAAVGGNPAPAAAHAVPRGVPKLPAPVAAVPPPPPPPAVHLKAMLPAEAVAHALAATPHDPDVGLTADAIAASTAAAVAARLGCGEPEASAAVVAEVRRMVATGQLFTTIDDEHFAAA